MNDNSNLSILNKHWTLTEAKVKINSKGWTGVFIRTYDDIHRALLSLWNLSKIDKKKQFAALFLNKDREVVAFKKLKFFTDEYDQDLIDVKIIASIALKIPASYVIIANSHPCGRLKPTGNDSRLTRRMRDTLRLVDCELLDHIIISKNWYFSKAENGLLVSQSDDYPIEEVGS